MRKFVCTVLTLFLVMGISEAGNRFRFTLNAIGDIQIDHYYEFDYAGRTIFAELLGSEPSAINLFLGDQVNGRMEDHPAFKAHADLLPQEYHVVIGNHDRDVAGTAEGQEESFRKYFGSPDYTFLKGNVQFIVLNNVFGLGPRNYEGRFREDQLEWIRSILKKTPAKRQIVFAMHIPLASTKNTGALLSLLRGRGDILCISGHTHNVQRRIIEGDGVRINDISVGATCGHWWTGERDWEGIPSAIQAYGAPRGYFVFDFNKKGYEFRFKGVGLDEGKQMSIEVCGIDPAENDVDSLAIRARGDVYVSVYGACSETEVEISIDGGHWMPMSRTTRMDHNVARILTVNHLSKHKGTKYPSTFSRRNPLRRTPSPQVYTITLPREAQSGIHSIRIKARDPWGFKAEGSRTYYFAE
ncbi:MAG: calcineurin-like phosphoesterase C-terminal domain-containing protein [Bacteroidales bacterium]|nr:calcineurin-like phosphoesterase C-terminal domain-containing protein [Bacteroidales bacterium]